MYQLVSLLLWRLILPLLRAVHVLAECMNLLSESELSVAVSKCSRCKLAYFCSKVGAISVALQRATRCVWHRASIHIIKLGAESPSLHIAEITSSHNAVSGSTAEPCLL
jgi:hypothetical protein